jgi:hypothetical protein
MKKQLPKRLSSLLIASVDDAIKLSRQRSKFKLDMTDFVKVRDVVSTPDGPIFQKLDRCHVCMAGAVMVCRLDANTVEGGHPSELPEELEDKMYAIDSMRTGEFYAAYLQTHDNREPTLAKHAEALHKADEVVRKAYSNTAGRAPWRAYRKAAAVLKAAGL